MWSSLFAFASLGAPPRCEPDLSAVRLGESCPAQRVPRQPVGQRGWLIGDNYARRPVRWSGDDPFAWVAPGAWVGTSALLAARTGDHEASVLGTWLFTGALGYLPPMPDLLPWPTANTGTFAVASIDLDVRQDGLRASATCRF